MQSKTTTARSAVDH